MPRSHPNLGNGGALGHEAAQIAQRDRVFYRAVALQARCLRLRVFIVVPRGCGRIALQFTRHLLQS